MTDAPERGRPSKYTQEIADEICTRLSDGESLREICRDDHMPHESTVRKWHVQDRQGFSTQYARAREAQAFYIADELLDISDDGSNDWMRRSGADQAESWQANGEHIQRSKLRVDTRKWVLAKMLPKVYGDKLELGGKDGGPVKVDVTATELAKGVVAVFEKARQESEK